MRQVHDCAFSLAGRLAGIVAGSLPEDMVANLRHEFYHVCREGIAAFAEAARLERRRLDPTGKGE